MPIAYNRLEGALFEEVLGESLTGAINEDLSRLYCVQHNPNENRSGVPGGRIRNWFQGVNASLSNRPHPKLTPAQRALWTANTNAEFTPSVHPDDVLTPQDLNTLKTGILGIISAMQKLFDSELRIGNNGPRTILQYVKGGQCEYDAGFPKELDELKERCANDSELEFVPTVSGSLDDDFFKNVTRIVEPTPNANWLSVDRRQLQKETMVRMATRWTVGLALLGQKLTGMENEPTALGEDCGMDQYWAMRKQGSPAA